MIQIGQSFLNSDMQELLYILQNAVRYKDLRGMLQYWFCHIVKVWMSIFYIETSLLCACLLVCSYDLVIQFNIRLRLKFPC